MRLSKIISGILHPIFMPIIAVYLSVTLTPNISFTITNYLPFIYIILCFSTIVMPLIGVLFLIKTKLVTNLEMNNHKERSLPLLITAIWMIFGYYKLAEILFMAPILNAIILFAIITVIIASIISNYWKISLHMMALGGLFGVIFSLSFLFGNLFWVLIMTLLFAGILGCSRLNERAHNNTQIYVGFLMGFFIEAAGILLF